MDIHLEGVEIEGEGVDLRTALNGFKTAKQRATLANHTSVSKDLNRRFHRRNCKSRSTLLSHVHHMSDQKVKFEPPAVIRTTT